MPETEGRFRTLIQSPLRAGILRFLSARPQETFDIETLMATFGRLRLDVENCLIELVDFGLVTRADGEPPRYSATESLDDQRRELLDTFLERSATVSMDREALPALGRTVRRVGQRCRGIETEGDGRWTQKEEVRPHP